MLAWIGLAVQTSLLAAEAQSVIALRVAEIATGRGSLAESQLMVTEKMLALAEAATLVATGGNAHGVVQGYRKKVQSNAKRLKRKRRTRGR
jgi:hypothetical protein